MESLKKSMTKRGNALISGRHSPIVQKFLKKHNLEKLELPKTQEFHKEMAFRITAYEERTQRIQMIADMFKDFNTRGMTILDTLLDLDMKMLDYESKLKRMNINPIEDPNYMKAVDLKLKMAAFLNKMNFDKAKAVADRAVNKEITDDDALFLVES